MKSRFSAPSPRPAPSPLDDDWDGGTSTITLDDRMGPEALTDVAASSHVEVVFVVDRTPPEKVRTASYC